MAVGQVMYLVHGQLANSPYVVTGDIYVQSGESLTIEAGVEVRFYGNFPFYAYGSLIAEGTEVDSIYFMNHVDDGISKWKGLRLHGYNYPDYEQYTMSYVSVSGTDDAGMFLTDLFGSTTVSISHSTFQNNPWAGLYLSWLYDGEAPVNISDCRFINNQEGNVSLLYRTLCYRTG